MTLNCALWYPAREMARRKKKKKPEPSDEQYQWCPLRESRVSIETCRHQAFVEGDPACLRCMQRDLFSAATARKQPRGPRKKS